MAQDEADAEIEVEYSEPSIDGDENDEELDDDDVVYQITTSGADFDVDGLVKRFDRGSIYRRNFKETSYGLGHRHQSLLSQFCWAYLSPACFFFERKKLRSS